MRLDLILDVDRRLFISEKGGRAVLKPWTLRDDMAVAIYPVTKRDGMVAQYEVFNPSQRKPLLLLTYPSYPGPGGADYNGIAQAFFDVIGTDTAGEPPDRWLASVEWEAAPIKFPSGADKMQCNLSLMWQDTIGAGLFGTTLELPIILKRTHARE